MRAGAAIVLAASLVLPALPTAADVRTTTTTRSYSVGGSTASALVSYMRTRPLQGDYGDAVANIHPTYGLSVATAPGKGGCRASKVTLNIHFRLTLPTARSSSSMAASTRSAWNSFTAYARRHEDTHKRIYVQCGNTFVAKAQRITAGNCAAVQAAARRLLESEKRICETKQRAYDRAERSRVAGMSLFSMARARSRGGR